MGVTVGDGLPESDGLFETRHGRDRKGPDGPGEFYTRSQVTAESLKRTDHSLPEPFCPG